MREDAFVGQTLLLVEPDLNAALRIQDELTASGARVFTAYSLERGLKFADMEGLAGAILGSIGNGPESDQLRNRLSFRKIPLMKYAPLAGDRRTCH